MKDAKDFMKAANAAIGAAYRGREVTMLEDYVCPDCGTKGSVRREYERWTTRMGWPTSGTRFTCTTPGCNHYEYHS